MLPAIVFSCLFGDSLAIYSGATLPVNGASAAARTAPKLPSSLSNVPLNPRPIAPRQHAHRGFRPVFATAEVGRESASPLDRVYAPKAEGQYIPQTILQDKVPDIAAVEAASKQGNFHATLYLAEQIRDGHIPHENPAVTAARLYFLAARQSHFSFGVAALTELAEQGNPIAQLHVGDVVRYYFKNNANGAQKYYLNAAQHGLPEAMYEVARGMEGDPANAKISKKWYTRAKSEGFSLEQYTQRMRQIGVEAAPSESSKAEAVSTEKKVFAVSKEHDHISVDDLRVAPSLAEIARIAKMADDEKQIAIPKNQEMILGLAHAYQTGATVEKNVAEANRLYKKLALAGNIQAVLDLAHNFATGDGVQQHVGTAANLYYLAAVYGKSIKIQGSSIDFNVGLHQLQALEEHTHHDMARIRLGDYYKFNAKPDLEKSLNYYRLASQDRHPEALYQMVAVSKELKAFKGLQKYEFRLKPIGYKIEEDKVKQMQMTDQNMLKPWLPELLKAIN